MTQKKSKTAAVKKKNNANKLGRTKKKLEVRTKVPAYDRYGRFTKLPNNHGVKYGTIVLIAVLAGFAATISSIGNAALDQFGFTGQPAADLWWILVGIAGTSGFLLAVMDWVSKGNI